MSRPVINEMRWSGLDWQEGPDIGGPSGPYKQTQRMALYRKYFERLKDSDVVYPCYCTPALLALRVAVSGRTISPPLFEIMYLLGRERVERRLLRW